MKPNDLAAAVQRLQRVDDLEHGNGCRLLTGTAALREVYGEAPEAFRVDGMDLDWLENQLWQDRKALADAYLAREADDAKPVDREWQSMATAPRDGTEILLVVESRAGIPGKMLVGHYMRGGHCIEDRPPIDRGWYYWTGSMFGVAEKPVAWMPLPDWPTNETTPGGGDAAK